MLAKTEVPIPPSVEAVIKNILEIRKFLKDAEEQYKEHVAPAVANMERMSANLLAFLDAAKIKSVRTDAGTAYVNVLPSASCSDPDVFMNYVKESGELDLLNRSPNKTACMAYAEKNGAEPPGVKLSFKRSALVRTSA